MKLSVNKLTSYCKRREQPQPKDGNNRKLELRIGSELECRRGRGPTQRKALANRIINSPLTGSKLLFEKQRTEAIVLREVPYINCKGSFVC